MKKQKISYVPSIVGSWDIPNINYKGETKTYRLFEKMTPLMNQKELSEFYETEKQKGNPVPADAPLIWAICTQAEHLYKNSKTSELKNFLNAGFGRNLLTLTKINYARFEFEKQKNNLWVRKKKDKIIHNINTSAEYSLDADIIGPSNWFSKIPDKNILESLLGTKNIKEINKVSQWINKTDGFLCRYENPEKVIEEEKRVFVFHAGFLRFESICNAGLGSSLSTFLVLRVE